MKTIYKKLGAVSVFLSLIVFSFGGALLAQAASYTAADVATHNTAGDCWVIVNGNVYNLTSFIASHPGGPSPISSLCGLDGSASFNGQHSASTLNSVSNLLLGPLTTTSDTLLGTLSAQDFGVVNYDTGLGITKGYTAGFGLADNTLAGATSVEVKLYNGNTLLQTNTAILPKFNMDITGTQFSSPFDVSGTFDYATDGYWTNVRASEYGLNVPATRVVATVTLANGKVVTAENTTLTGDPTTIMSTNPVPPVNGGGDDNNGTGDNNENENNHHGNKGGDNEQHGNGGEQVNNGHHNRGEGSRGNNNDGGNYNHQSRNEQRNSHRNNDN